MEKNDSLHGYVRKHSYVTYTLCILLVCYVVYRIYKRCRSNNCCGKLCIRVEQNVQPRLEISIRNENEYLRPAILLRATTPIPSVSFDRNAEQITTSFLKKED
jgi:hypothetical protein